MAEALRLARSKGMLRTQEQEEQRHGRTNDMKAQKGQTTLRLKLATSECKALHRQTSFQCGNSLKHW